MIPSPEYEKQNKGLPSRFYLNNGKFVLVGGKKKVDDNMAMFLSFVGWFRYFTQDYVINVYAFFQNTTSYLQQFKNTLRLRILEVGSRYIPFADIRAVDIPVNYAGDRKATTVFMQYKYRLKNVEEVQTIKKIIL